MREASVGFQCPDCVAAGRRTVRPARTAFGASRAGEAGYVTIALIAINVIVLLAGAAMSGMDSLFGGLFSGSGRIHYLGAVIGPSFISDPNNLPPGVEAGEVFTGVDDGAAYRLVTGMFIHFGPLHLLMNMWALWVLGRSLEAAFGPLRFLALYMLCGIGGSVAALLFQPNALTAGASGAIFGLFAALFIAMKRLGKSTSSVLPIIVINLVITFTIPGISIAGHLGGMATGALLGAGLAYAPRNARVPVQVGIFAATAVVLTAFTVFSIAL